MSAVVGVDRAPVGPPVPVTISTRSLRRPCVRVTQSRDCHREYFGGEEYEAVAFNKDQHIVVVGQRVTPDIRQTASFLGSKGIHVTCVEFTFFQAEGGAVVCYLTRSSWEENARSPAARPWRLSRPYGSRWGRSR